MDHSDDSHGKRALLEVPRRIAVVGASPNPARDSHKVYVFLRDHGHHVIAVNPVADEVAGDPAVPDLAGATARWGAPPDIVDVFRAPEHLQEIVDEAVKAGATWLWTQFGVVDHDALEQAQIQGLRVVADRCIKVEMGRLGL